MFENKHDTPEHAADHFLMYLKSSIVHCPVNTQWHEALSVLMHGDVTPFRTNYAKNGCGNFN